MTDGHRTDGRERLLGGYGGRMLFVLVLSWTTIQTVRFAIPPLLPEIRADLSLSLAQAGIVMSVLQGAYAVSQYPSGSLSDSWSRSTLIAPALAVIAVGCLLVGVATSFLVLLLSSAVFGLGKGLYSTPSRAMLSDLFVRSRGRALGLYGAGSDLGGVVASGLAVVVLAVGSWRASFLPLAVLLAGLVALFVGLTREPYVVHRADLQLRSTVRRLVATRSRRRTLVAFALFYFMVNGVMNFLPAYLREVKGISPTLASANFALLFVLGMAVRPVAGSTSDRFSRPLVATTGMLLSAVGLAALLLVGSALAIVAAVALFALSFQGLQPVIDALVMDDAPEGKMGSDLGAARTLFTGIGSLGPAFVGVTAEYHSYTLAFAGLVGCLVVASGILLVDERE